MFFWRPFHRAGAATRKAQAIVFLTDLSREAINPSSDDQSCLVDTYGGWPTCRYEGFRSQRFLKGLTFTANFSIFNILHVNDYLGPLKMDSKPSKTVTADPLLNFITYFGCKGSNFYLEYCQHVLTVSCQNLKNFWSLTLLFVRKGLEQDWGEVGSNSDLLSKLLGDPRPAALSASPVSQGSCEGKTYEGRIARTTLWALEEDCIRLC